MNARLLTSRVRAAALLLLAVLVMCPSLGFAWPAVSDWKPVPTGATTFQDDDTDFQTQINLVGPGADSAYIFNDGSNFHVRLRIDDTALNNQNQLKSFGWGVLFDVDGNLNSYEYMLMLDGISEELYIAKNTSPTSVGDPSDKAETILWQQAAAQGATGNFRVTLAGSNFSGDPDYFLDFRAPYPVIKAALGIDDNDLIRLFFGTSASAQTLSKDLTGPSPSPDLYNGSSNIILPTGSEPTSATVQFVQSLAGLLEDNAFSTGETIYIRVEDPDQNAQSSVAETLTVLVSAPSGDDEEFVTLTETALDSGVFTGSLVTAGLGGSDNDGTLQVSPVEIVTTQYVDANDGNYNINILRTDSIEARPAADLAVDVSILQYISSPDRGTTPNEGDELELEVTLTNNGPSSSFGSQLKLNVDRASVDYSPGQSMSGLDLEAFTATSPDSYNSSTGIWTVGGLASGASRSLVIRVTIASGTVDESLIFSGTIQSSAQPDIVSSNNSDALTLSVQGADLAITKTVDNSSPGTGDSVTFTLTAINNGSGSADNVTVADPLPAGLSLTGSFTATGSYAGGVWSIGTLGVGATATLTIDATVTGAAGDTIVNSATIDSDRADPVSSNNASTATIFVGGSDLAIEKVVDNSSPAEGGTVNFTLTARNLGANSADSVVVNDVLPSGLTYVSHNASVGSYSNATGEWTIGTIAGGTTGSGITLTLTATVDAGTAGTTITNSAEILSGSPTTVDIDPSNNIDDAALSVTFADLALTKTVDDETPVNGQVLTFTLTVTNNGPSNAGGIEVTDYIPQYLTNVTSADPAFDTSTGIWTVGTVNSGTSAQLIFTAEVDVKNSDPNSFFNTASITASGEADPDASNNTSSVPIKIGGTDVAVGITVAPDPTPAEGDTLTYTVTMTNNGPADADGIVVNALLPAGLTFVSSTVTKPGDASFGTYSDASGEWALANNDTLLVGETATLTITATVDAGTNGSTITTTANLTNIDQADTNTVNDSASVAVVVGAADLGLTKTVDNATPNVGDQVEFVVTLTNNGPNNITSAEVTDSLPAGLTLVSATPSAGAFNAGVWTLGALANGASVTLTIVADVVSGAGSTLTNTASLTGSSNPDPDSTNDSASAAVTVQLVDLAVIKLVDDATPDTGSTVTYTIIVNNNGPNDATGVTVTDVVDCGAQSTPCVSYVTDSSGGSYNASTGVWTVGNIAAYDAVSLLLTVTINGAGGIDIINTATAAADQTDGDPNNDSASIAVTPRVIPDLSTSTKAITNIGDVNPGDTLQYLITLINSAPTDAEDVEFSDTLATSPVALTYLSSSTTCTDNLGNTLTPVFSAGEVTLTGIVVPASSSCTVTINSTVGSGSPGDLIDNTAVIVNPNGPGATPRVATLLLSESAIVDVEGKQLYLRDFSGSRDLVRVPPSSGESLVLNDTNTVESFLVAGTQRAAQWDAGDLGVNVYLDSNNLNNGALRSVTVTVRANLSAASSGFTVGSQTRVIPLTATPTEYKFRIPNPTTYSLGIGATFQVEIRTNDADATLPVRLSQVAAAPYSELVVPLTNAIEITDISFFDRSATDETGLPVGCAATFSCGTELSPAEVVAGSTIWMRARISDLFGAADVNPGCELASPVNCPTYTLIYPRVSDPDVDVTPVNNELTYLRDAQTDVGGTLYGDSRVFEVELNPSGMGYDGTWEVTVTGNEGTEGVYQAVLVATFVRLGQPSLVVVKSSASSSAAPGEVVTFTNSVTNNGAGPASDVTLVNTVGNYMSIELVDDGGSWTAIDSLPGYTIANESFDNGSNTFAYDPTAGPCGAPAATPCYDPSIRKHRVLLIENVPASATVTQTYRARVE